MLGGQVFEAFPSAGLMSELWATSSMYMNDANEFRRGRDVISQELDKLPNDDTRRMMKSAVKDADPLEVYCACFSAIDDDLSQWRGYGDNGAGICIEFSLPELLAGLDGAGYWVVYGKPGDEDLQIQVARDLLDYIHSAIRTALPQPPVPGSVADEVREQLRELWPALFLALKHRDFSAEREFRIVYSEAIANPLHTWFRPAPIVPFVKLGMLQGNRLPILSIRLGPAASSDANQRSLRLALDKLGLGHIAVKKSDIPYVPR